MAVRLDPFRTIINVEWGGAWMIVYSFTAFPVFFDSQTDPYGVISITGRSHTGISSPGDLLPNSNFGPSTNGRAVFYDLNVTNIIRNNPELQTIVFNTSVTGTFPGNAGGGTYEHEIFMINEDTLDVIDIGYSIGEWFPELPPAGYDVSTGKFIEY